MEAPTKGSRLSSPCTPREHSPPAPPGKEPAPLPPRIKSTRTTRAFYWRKIQREKGDREKCFVFTHPKKAAQKIPGEAPTETGNLSYKNLFAGNVMSPLIGKFILSSLRIFFPFPHPSPKPGHSNTHASPRRPRQGHARGHKFFDSTLNSRKRRKSHASKTQSTELDPRERGQRRLFEIKNFNLHSHTWRL